MKFSKYFNLWLHEGYYKKGVKIGKEGDFYTSVSVGSLFGICIAKRILELSLKFDLSGEQTIHIVEIGANEGHLLADIIQGIYTLNPKILDKFDFCIIEPHENLRKLQKNTFSKRFAEDITLNHLDKFSKAKFENAIFIANELFDSFACELYDNGKMLYIEDNKPFFLQCDTEIKEIAHRFSVTKGEITPSFFEFAKEMKVCADKFYFISFDYGEIGAKNDFTLRVYKAHNVYNFFEITNLDEFFAVSDLTYSLNFEIIKAAFEDVGCLMSDFRTQASALVKFGGTEILELILENGGENSYKNAMYQFKRLISPSEFGDKFKMIEIKKGF